MSSRPRSLGPEELALRLSLLASRLFQAASIQEIFEIVGAGFAEMDRRFCVWELQSAVMRLRYDNWMLTENTHFMGELEGTPLMHVDAAPIPPFLFTERRCFFVNGDEMLRIIVEAFRDSKGRRLSSQAVESLLAEDAPKFGVFGPLFLFDAPWGLVSFNSPDEGSEQELAILTIFSSQIGAAMDLVASRGGLLSANHELNTIQSLARAGSAEERERLFSSILESAAVATDSDAAAFYLWDDAHQALAPAGSFGEPSGWLQEETLHAQSEGSPLHEAAMTQTPAVANRPGSPQPHLVAMPLLREDRLLGIMTLSRKARAFLPFEVQRAELLTSQISVQIENASLIGEAQRQYDLLSGLYRLGRAVSLSLDIRRLTGEALDLLVASLRLDAAWIYSAQRDQLSLEGWRAVSGTDFHASLAPSLSPESHFACARSVRERVPVMVGAGSEAIQPREVRHLAAVPLIASERAIGCLAVARFSDQKFRQHEVELIESYASQIAVAVEHARLSRAERERVRELRFLSEVGKITAGVPFDKKKLLEEFLDQTRHGFGFEVNIGFISSGEEGEELEWQLAVEKVDASFADAGGVLAAAREAGLRLLTMPEARFLLGEEGLEDSMAYLCAIPLRAPTGTRAVVSLVRRGHPISDQEIETLVAGGAKIGLALENARRFQETSRSLEEMKLLLDVGQAITGTLELEAVLVTSTEIITRLVGASHAFILLVDEDSHTLRGAAASNTEWRDSFREVVIPLDQNSLAARVIHARAPIVVEDASCEGRLNRERVLRYQEKSLLAVPLMVRDEPIGCILVADTRGPRNWRSSEVERVTLIAHQAAVAVTNARLYDDLRSSYTELAKTQEELVKQERLAALGELSAVVAHEVRNPLGVIFNSLSSLKRLLRPQGDAATLLGIVGEEADRLDKIVGDLLEFAKPNPLDLQLEDLGILVSESLLAIPMEDARLDVVVDIAPGLPKVMVDGRLIRQALLNLFLNAVQSMPEGGPLLVRVDRIEKEGRRFVRTEIIDHGRGIPDELAAKIFQPFFTTKATGTGLGLAVVKRIIDAHQGELIFESRPGEGTTFSLCLGAAEKSS